ncbi:hypothetical protein WMY93_011328 [Mugilogobius chulae]|uniref:receptor protein serine/threonine kinase n=1 Tax=Mugilogobius chulae TaxID=88201 RepID=A0AAW0P1Q5_9GOBI
MALLLGRWWCLVLEFALLRITNLALSQRRRCIFQVQPDNLNYNFYGYVNGSEQYCYFTNCCVGYYQMKDGELVVDNLSCYLEEKSCSDFSCLRKRNKERTILRCVCNSDFCNYNITWAEDQLLPITYSYTNDGILVVGLIMALVGFCVAATTMNCFRKERKETLNSSLRDPLCACITTQPSDIDIADIQLLQIVSKGIFATVWEGKYQDSCVAVKCIPMAWKHKFTTERDIYQLPLMAQAGIVQFLGSGSIGTCEVLVLQYAKYGSLHSYLSTHISNWKSSLTLCQSLSQGLSFLHADLLKDGVHKPRVAHRDLSSSNVLVKADGTCALSDFGCSSILCYRQNHQQFYSRKLEVENPMGTLCYMPPEILLGSVELNGDWCLQGDVYSLGLVLWEIWMRCSDLFGSYERVPPHLLPYEYEFGTDVSLENLLHYVFNMNQRPKIPQVWDQHPQGAALQDLLSCCWDLDAEARLAERGLWGNSAVYNSSRETYLTNMWPNQGPPPMGPPNPAYPPGYNPAYPPGAPGNFPPPSYSAGQYPAGTAPNLYPGAMPYGVPPGGHPYPAGQGGYPAGVPPGPYPHSPKGGHHKDHKGHHKGHHKGPHGNVGYPMGFPGPGMGVPGHKAHKKMKKMKKNKKGHKGKEHHKHGGKSSSSSSSSKEQSVSTLPGSLKDQRKQNLKPPQLKQSDPCFQTYPQGVSSTLLFCPVPLSAEDNNRQAPQSPVSLFIDVFDLLAVNYLFTMWPNQGPPPVASTNPAYPPPPYYPPSTPAAPGVFVQPPYPSYPAGQYPPGQYPPGQYGPGQLPPHHYPGMGPNPHSGAMPYAAPGVHPYAVSGGYSHSPSVCVHPGPFLHSPKGLHFGGHKGHHRYHHPHHHGNHHMPGGLAAGVVAVGMGLMGHKAHKKMKKKMKKAHKANRYWHGKVRINVFLFCSLCTVFTFN